MKFSDNNKGKNVIRTILVMSLSSLLLSCATPGGQGLKGDKKNDVAEYMETLEQKLSNMQTELEKTSANVSELKQVIDSTLKKNQPPAPPSVAEVSFDDDPVMGDENAQIAIVEFSDFQCPYCSSFHQRYFPTIKRDYIDTGKVKFVYRDLALDFHPESENAAVAANCAGEQNAYFEMHDLLFKNQQSFVPEFYDQLARNLDLNTKEFSDCTKGNKQKQEVRMDLAEAEKIGISGTPAFFIGRVIGNKIVDVKFMEGAQTPVAFSRVIDEIIHAKNKIAALR